MLKYFYFVDYYLSKFTQPICSSWLILALSLSPLFFGSKKASLFATIVIESFAVQLMSLPYIMQIFGRISLVGLIANIIIVVLVPLGNATIFICYNKVKVSKRGIIILCLDTLNGQQLNDKKV